MQKRWLFRPRADQHVSAFLQHELRVDDAIAELLVQRGVDTFRKAKAFFRPSLDELHDPFLMKGMREAILYTRSVMEKKGKILLYGDYDVDGTTSVALLYRFLTQHYREVGYYIPDRHKEGYGVSMTGIDWAAENGYSLIITLDCGITAVEQVDYAQSKGIDVIVSDHHLPAEKLPNAVAILNPKQHDCEYPYKELSGCGIGFKFAQAYTEHFHLDPQPLYELLDLLAVSIASDIVPITGENRIMAAEGLKKLNENPCPGLLAIRNLMPLRKELSISDIVFNIGPRINAAGRMGDAKKSVDLLIATNFKDAEARASIVDIDNAERRDVDTSITKEALQQAIQIENFQSRRTTVVFGEHWHKGVIGIVASRLIEQYHRPTIVFSRADGKLTGSARTVNGFNIYEALTACSEYIEQFGGHKFAAGLTIRHDSYDAFVEKFEEVVAATIQEDQLIPRVEIDLKIKLDRINSRFVRLLKQFAPFGPGNMMPVFCSETVWSEAGTPRIVGENHLLFTVTQENGPSFQAIAFGMAEHHPRISKGIPFNMAYTIEENVWKGQTSIKLNIKDIQYG